MPCAFSPPPPQDKIRPNGSLGNYKAPSDISASWAHRRNYGSSWSKTVGGSLAIWHRTNIFFSCLLSDRVDGFLVASPSWSVAPCPRFHHLRHSTFAHVFCVVGQSIPFG